MAPTWRDTKDLGKRLLAELLGTYILVLIGCGSAAQVTLSDDTNGNFVTSNIASGVAVAIAVFVSAEFSGGHVNPAVTTGFALVRGFPLRDVVFYWTAQYIGGFLAAATIFGLYYDSIVQYDGGTRYTTGPNQTASIFASFPQESAGTVACVFNEAVGTAVLILVIVSLTDPKNSFSLPPLIPWAIGVVIMMVGMSFGSGAGGCIMNPARDLSPRIFIRMAGWGREPFSFRKYNWFWIPAFVPHLGAVFAVVVYQLMIGLPWRNSGRPYEDIGN